MISALLEEIPHRQLSSYWKDGGIVELYAEVEQYAELSGNIALNAHPDVIYPGVYCYEVDEEFGRYLAVELIAGTYEHDRARKMLGEIALEFFSECPENISLIAPTIGSITTFYKESVSLATISPVATSNHI